MTKVTVTIPQDQMDAMLLGMASNGTARSKTSIGTQVASGVGRATAFVANVGTIAGTVYSVHRTEGHKARIRVSAFKDETTKILHRELRRKPTVEEIYTRCMETAGEVFNT